MVHSESSYHTANSVEDFQHNIAHVQEKIAKAAQAAGRNPEEIRLLPVSKTVDQDRIRNAYAAGLTQLGENKVQEAQRKSQEMADLDISWSVIGNLQSNKAKFVAQFADEFQALSSLKVAGILDRRLQALGRSIDVFIQVNTSFEEQKYGLHPDEVAAFLKEMPQYQSLNVKGLMTLAVFSHDADEVRPCFQLLKNLQTRLSDDLPDGVSLDELSMGMSGDYELAITEGSTVVRVGQAIFGPRATPDSEYWPNAS